MVRELIEDIPLMNQHNAWANTCMHNLSTAFEEKLLHILSLTSLSEPNNCPTVSNNIVDTQGLRVMCACWFRVQHLQEQDVDNIFENPVVGIPSYAKTVVYPICFSQILERLESEDYYMQAEHVIYDLDIMWDNAISFNGLHSPITDLAVELKQCTYEIFTSAKHDSSYSAIIVSEDRQRLQSLFKEVDSSARLSILSKIDKTKSPRALVQRQGDGSYELSPDLLSYKCFFILQKMLYEAIASQQSRSVQNDCMQE